MMGRSGLGLAVCAALAWALAACGSSNDSGGATAATTSSSSSKPAASAAAEAPQSDGGFPAADAPDKKATGKPLVFAMNSVERSSQVSFIETRQAAQQAAAYVNTKLGGIAGRPVKVIYCAVDATPGSTTDCTNKLLRQKPDAFIGGPDTNTAISVPMIQKAGLAYLGGVSFGGPEAASPNSFQFAGGVPIGFAAMGQYAAQGFHAKTLATDAVGGQAGAAGQVAPKIVSNAAVKAGIPRDKIKIAQNDPTAADLTPLISEMNSGSPDALALIMTPQQCVPIIKARKSLGVTTPTVIPAGCADPRVIAATGGAATGIYAPFEARLPGDNGPDVKLFETWMKQHAPKVLLTEFAESGFIAVMNAYSVLNQLKPDEITPAKILSSFTEAKDVHNFMGTTFACDHPSAAFPAFCNTKQLMAQVQADGSWKPVGKVFDAAAYASLK